jgi:hypothetical protein
MDAPFSPRTIRLAAAIPATLNAEERTVEVIANSGRPIPGPDRLNPFDAGPGEWRLQFDLEGGNFDRFVGAPVLARHGSTEIRDQLGTVVSWRIADDGLRATLKFGTRPEAAGIFDDIVAGIVQSVSIGAYVWTWESHERPEDGGAPLMIAREWMPFEITVVAMGQDPAARFLAFQPGAAPPAADSDVPACAADYENIRTLAAQNNLDPKAIIMTASASGAPTRAALHESLLNAIAERQAPIFAALGRLGAPRTEPPRAAVIDAMGEALFCRFKGTSPSERAREFMGLRIADMAREALIASGARGIPRDPARIIEMAVAPHTTSDFPKILGSAANRVMLDGYERAAAAIKAIARVRLNVPDFRTVDSIRLSGITRLEEVNEAGEVKAGTATEAAESYRIRTFARAFHLSRTALINDDLGAMTAVALMGAATAETEAAEIVALLALNSGAGPTMKDGNPLFRVASNNLASSGTVLDTTNLAVGIAAMRGQTDAGGNLVQAEPSIIMVGPARELAARQLIAQVTAATVATVNPYAGAFNLVVEPRLTGNQWFIWSAPERVPVIEIAYLAGSDGRPTVETFTEVETLGVSFRIVHDFGLGAVGRAGVWRNPGA